MQETTSPTETDDQGTAEAGRTFVVSNQSTIGEMLWVGFYTAILSALTLTIFRFWGRTHFRQRLWSATTIDWEPLEYCGTGKELFLGFLFAVFAFMVPVIGVILLAQLFLDPAFAAVAVLILYVFLFVLMGAAVYLSRRYHLSRTKYRGVRFALTGSSIKYALVTIGYWLLVTITLGWFYPASRIRLAKRMWENSYYGSKKFEFVDTDEAMQEPVYKSFAVAFFGGLAAYGVWVSLIFGSIDMKNPAIGMGLEQILTIYLSFIPLALIVSIFVSWHQAVMMRRITKSLVLGDMRFTSTVSAKDIFLLYLTNMLLFVFTLGFGAMATQMRMWKLFANRLAIVGHIDFAEIAQSEADAPALGEGLIDSLDMSSNF